MNKTQQKLLELSLKKNIWEMSLRDIAKEVGIKNAASIKYHLDQLEKQNILKKPNYPSLKEFKENLLKSWNTLINIPVLGQANCGVPLAIAEERFDGYLKVSLKLLPSSNVGHFFALKAEGDSMNRASVNGQNIESGDYVIVDKANTQPENGKYVLSIIDGCANIKKLFYDGDKEEVALVSESTENYNPIYIHKEDNFLINGTVILVIKNPLISSN